MKPSATTIAVVALCVAQQVSAQGVEKNSDLVPPIAPSAEETHVAAVPAWRMHVELNECLESTKRLLSDPAHAPLHVQVGNPFITLNAKWGYLLHADFTRDDVAAPLVNRILCWADGQLIVSRLPLEPLAAIAASSPPLLVPGARQH